MAEKRICPNCGQELPIKYGKGRVVRSLTPGSVVVCAACAYVLKVTDSGDLGLLTQAEWKFFQDCLEKYGQRQFIEMLRGAEE